MEDWTTFFNFSGMIVDRTLNSSGIPLDSSFAALLQYAVAPERFPLRSFSPYADILSKIVQLTDLVSDAYPRFRLVGLLLNGLCQLHVHFLSLIVKSVVSSHGRRGSRITKSKVKPVASSVHVTGLDVISFDALPPITPGPSNIYISSTNTIDYLSTPVAYEIFAPDCDAEVFLTPPRNETTRICKVKTSSIVWKCMNTLASDRLSVIVRESHPLRAMHSLLGTKLFSLGNLPTKYDAPTLDSSIKTVYSSGSNRLELDSDVDILRDDESAAGSVAFGGFSRRVSAATSISDEARADCIPNFYHLGEVDSKQFIHDGMSRIGACRIFLHFLELARLNDVSITAGIGFSGAFRIRGFSVTTH